MKVGIYLGYEPGVKLNKEGLGRYLAKVVKTLCDNGDEIIIACPSWLNKEIRKLFNEFDIRGKNDIINVAKLPFSLRVWFFFQNIKKGKKKKHSLKKFFEIIISIIEWLFLQSNSMVFLISFMILITLGILLSPVVLLFAAFVLFLRVSKKVAKKSARKLYRGFEYLYEYTYKNYVDFRKNLYWKALSNTRKLLCKHVNTSNVRADIWYSPSIFWPEFNDIIGKKMVNVPDLVTSTFPIQWGNHYDELIKTNECRRTIEESDYFITYSEYISRTLLQKKFGKDEKSIFVIPHSINNLEEPIKLQNAHFSGEELKKWESAICREILQQAKYHVVNEIEYVRDYDIKSAKYIFYASQDRPHKNILNLVKAYEYLLRRRYINMKLFLTANINNNPELMEYIREKELEHDVLAFYDLSQKELAAFYHEANLVVNPTLYEGGFPFTFGEGMSVGVPSVMSSIPQVLEEISNSEFVNNALFDPYNVDDIAKKIEYGLNNRERLYEIELETYNRMLVDYSEKESSKRYINAFSCV